MKIEEPAIAKTFRTIAPWPKRTWHHCALEKHTQLTKLPKIKRPLKMDQLVVVTAEHNAMLAFLGETRVFT